MINNSLFIFIYYRLGLADRQRCENALKRTEYDVDLAASLLLDQVR